MLLAGMLCVAIQIIEQFSSMAQKIIVPTKSKITSVKDGPSHRGVNTNIHPGFPNNFKIYYTAPFTCHFLRFSRTWSFSYRSTLQITSGSHIIENVCGAAPLDHRYDYNCKSIHVFYCIWFTLCALWPTKFSIIETDYHSFQINFIYPCLKRLMSLLPFWPCGTIVPSNLSYYGACLNAQ